MLITFIIVLVTFFITLLLVGLTKRAPIVTFGSVTPAQIEKQVH